VGGARTALFNWLYARKFDGDFLLRIEDTDRVRSTEESTRAIFEGLSWLGLHWDEEPVHQASGLDRHRADGQRLLERDTAYRCFCTTPQLDARRVAAQSGKDGFKYDRRCDRLPAGEVERRVASGEPFVVRFRVPEGTTEWTDLVHGPIAFPNKDVEDFVILRSDGTPIYNMAVVSDDIAMKITVVMRGDDHISNTPKQIMIYNALGALPPLFAHVPMINGLDGKKLSKRHGATAVGDYQHQGILPGALVNFLALLGWSPGEDREVMSLEEMVEAFSADGLQAKAAIFDPKKLEWMNGQHLARSSAEMLAELVTPELVRAGLASEEKLHAHRDGYLALIDLLKVRSRTVHDIVRQATPYLSDRIMYDPVAVAKHWKGHADTSALLGVIRDRLAALTDWSALSQEATLRAVAEERGIVPGWLFQSLRVALTGASVSPGIFEVLTVMGRERTLLRLGQAMAEIDALGQ